MKGWVLFQKSSLVLVNTFGIFKRFFERQISLNLLNWVHTCFNLWLHPQLCSPFCSNPPVAVSLCLWQFSLHVPLQCFLITKRKEICLSHLSKDRKTCQLTSLLGRQVLFSIAQQWDSLWAAASPPPQTGVSKGLHPQVPSLLLP